MVLSDARPCIAYAYAMAIKYLCSNPISLGWKKLVDTRLIWKKLKICSQVPD